MYFHEFKEIIVEILIIIRNMTGNVDKRVSYWFFRNVASIVQRRKEEKVTGVWNGKFWSLFLKFIC